MFWGGRDFSDEVIGLKDFKLWILDVDGNGFGKWMLEELFLDIRWVVFGGYI